jgi:flagellar basal body P-ring formation protein FlgA
MIRIAALVIAIAVATAAVAQIAGNVLLSPVPMAAGIGTARAAASPPAQPAPVAAERAPALPPALKREATVTGPIVRIGDLVENAGTVADMPIFRAPDLGQTGSVPAARVLEALRPHHIVALDTGGLDEVKVTRASRLVTASEIEGRVLRAFAGKSGLPDSQSLAINLDTEISATHVEPNAELGVARLAYDQRTHRFDVTFDLPGGPARQATLRVTGTLVETAEAVVPLRVLAQGEVIKAADVRIERRPKSDAIAIEEVLGLAAKRPLRPGQVIRAVDVMKPELVGRNETVTISFEAPGMVLSVRGQALESGAKGDVINVLNVQSKRTIQATVSGPGRVTVSAGSPRLAANTNTSHPRQGTE